MIEEKLNVMKTELQSVLEKERELEQALYQTRELKLRYMGGVEVLEKMQSEKEPAEKPVEKKEKVK